MEDWVNVSDFRNNYIHIDQVEQNYISVDVLKAAFECPSCRDYPRPYTNLKLCVNVHKVCGLCFSQFRTDKNRTTCITCQQPYRQFATIYGLHDVMNLINEKAKFVCLQSDYGCTEETLTRENVLQHDKECKYSLFKCIKEDCFVQFPWKDLSLQSHRNHVSPQIASNLTSKWNFKIDFSNLFDLKESRIKISPRIATIFPLCKESFGSIDPLYRPALCMRPHGSGLSIEFHVIWVSAPLLSTENIQTMSFQISAYVNTLYDHYIVHRDIVRPSFIFENVTSIFSISRDSLLHLVSLFPHAKCTECNEKNNHIHFQIFQNTI